MVEFRARDRGYASDALVWILVVPKDSLSRSAAKRCMYHLHACTILIRINAYVYFLYKTGRFAEVGAESHAMKSFLLGT